MKNAPWAKARDAQTKKLDDYPEVAVEIPELTPDPEGEKKELVGKLAVNDKPNPKIANVMTVGAGHFWTMEAVFRRVKGVKKVEAGYAGGELVDPTEDDLEDGMSGHVYAVQITYDEKETSFENLIKIFFKAHDPTSEKQGTDRGPQFKSKIFYHDLFQFETTKNIIIKLASRSSSAIITETQSLSKFYLAEEHNQNFYAKNPTDAYCSISIPKVLKAVEKLDGVDLQNPLN